jgi:plasmid stability protein
VAQVLVRQLDEEVVDALKRRAKANGRSLEAELREILREAASDPWEELIRVREALSGRSFSDSSELAREVGRR